MNFLRTTDSAGIDIYYSDIFDIEEQQLFRNFQDVCFEQVFKGD